MQGLWKTVGLFSQSMCYQTEKLITTPALPFRCVCRFKSVTNSSRQVSLQGISVRSADIVYQSSSSQLKLFCDGYHLRHPSFPFLHKSLLTTSNVKTLSALSSVSPNASWDNYNARTLTTFCLPLPYHNHLLNSNYFPPSPGQFRNISSHTRRQRKVVSRTLSTEKKEQASSDVGNKKGSETVEEADESKENLTLYQRFKKSYKEHGKVLIAVHLITSAFWFGSFYTIARCGIDIVPYLESWNFSDKVIKPFRSGGDIALAYLMYKLITPVRYTVTIGGTNLAIRYLRRKGRMQPVPEGDRLRELYKEGKQDLKIRSQQRMNHIRRIRNRIPRRRNRSGHKDKRDHH